MCANKRESECVRARESEKERGGMRQKVFKIDRGPKAPNWLESIKDWTLNELSSFFQVGRKIEIQF